MELIKLIYIGDKAINYTKDKKIILEPLCCLTRLALLKYKPEQTKICIHENGIYYVENDIFQGVIRTYYGDKREDLHNLYSPIMKSFEWFPKNNPYYKYIYETAILGLDKFTQTYDRNSIIYHTLTHYKTIIEEYLHDNENIKRDVGDSPLIDSLLDMWTEPEQKLIHDLLKLIDSDINKIIYIEILEKLLCDRESKVNSFIKNKSSSYDS
tara:strand:+ start:253 stop:885 length:633 start_codon:yes stop_codon:yes gene_type:complete